jgi:hypothetical protein
MVLMESMSDGEIPLPQGGGLTAGEESRNNQETSDHNRKHRDTKN